MSIIENDTGGGAKEPQVRTTPSTNLWEQVGIGAEIRHDALKQNPTLDPNIFTPRETPQK
jgi:hypothetical protein